MWSARLKLTQVDEATLRADDSALLPSVPCDDWSLLMMPMITDDGAKNNFSTHALQSREPDFLQLLRRKTQPRILRQFFRFY